MSSLAKSHYQITPAASLVKEYKGSMSVLKCVSGAYPGLRVHWEEPTAQPYTGENSEQLVNGEAFIAPGGHVDSFWITSGAYKPTVAADVVFWTLDCASPVVVLNSNPQPGAAAHVLKSENLGLVEVATGLLTPYTDAQPSGTGLDGTTMSVPISRRYVGGALRATSAAGGTLNVALWARVRPNADEWAEFARWDLTQQDLSATYYSCMFEVGGRSNFSATGTNIRNGPLLLPWPPFGLKLTVQCTVGSFADVTYALYERTE